MEKLDFTVKNVGNVLDTINGCDYNKEGICSNEENPNYNKKCPYKNQDKCPSSDFAKDTIGKVHETENYRRKRQFDPSQCEKGTYRTFTIGKGKKAVGCKVNGKFKVQSILEPKADLTEDVRKGVFNLNLNASEIRILLDLIEKNELSNEDPYFNEIISSINKKIAGEMRTHAGSEDKTLYPTLDETVVSNYIQLKEESKGKGWHGEPERHSKARKEGKADMILDFAEIDMSQQVDITEQFPNLKGDFTVLYGPIMRDGEFDYIDKKSNKKLTLRKDWDNLKEVSKNKTYIPARATEDDGAHQSPILGFTYGFEPKEETHQIYAKTVLLNDYKDLPSEGSQVSIGFPDEIQGNTQIVKDLDHLAISLRNKEQGRCKKEGYQDCYQKVVQDQNLIKNEVVN